MTLGAPLAPAAASSYFNEYSIYLFVTPTGPFIGDTVTATVEVYRWGILDDPENISAQAGADVGNTVPLALARTSVGVYTGSVLISEANIDCADLLGALYLSARARIAGANLSTSRYVELGNPDGGIDGIPCGNDLYSRVLNALGPEAAFPPGATVQMEARVYDKGVLTSNRTVGARARWFESTMHNVGDMTVTKVSTGVYHTSLTLPADLQDSREYTVEWNLDNGPWFGGHGFLFGRYAFVMQPYTGFGYLLNASDTALTAQFFAGGDRPMTGGRAFVGGALEDVYGGIQTLPLHYEPIGDKGSATVSINWTPPGTVDAFGGEDFGGKEVLYEVSPSSFFSFPPTWEGPTGIATVPCQVRILEDPTSWRPGETATIHLQVLQNESPLENDHVTLHVWGDQARRLEIAGNRTTGANGSVALTYTLQAEWNPGDDVNIVAICPNGQSGYEQWQVVGGRKPTVLSPWLRVSAPASHVGGSINVDAEYLGERPLTGATAFAWVVPNGDPDTVARTIHGQPPTAALHIAGSKLTGSVHVPDWLPTGEYVVIVEVTTVGADENLRDMVHLRGRTVTHMGPPTVDVQIARFVFDWWFLLVAVAGAAAIGALIRRRRGRALGATPLPATPPPPPPV